MTTLGTRAVVLGASMSGLLAARVLADHYEHVVVVERDVLPPPGETRRGVPQAEHAHLLLQRGAQVVERLFPGLLKELVAEGVPVTDQPAQCHISFGGHLLAQHGDPWPDPTYQVSRALLEGRLLQEVRALPGVEVRDGYDVSGLVGDAHGDQVTGVRIQPARPPGGEELLDADLTVVATGRSGRAARWLEELGYDPPAEEQRPIDLKYVSCRLRMPTPMLGRIRTVLIGPVPDRPSGMGLFEQENDTWILTASGYAGYHPPTEWPAVLAFLRGFVPEPILGAVEQAEPIGELHTHRSPTSLRRRYETMKRFPGGLLVVGDAVCSFNPLYGQGMTVAALQALALSESLTDGADGLARRYYRRAARPIDAAWQLSTGADLALPQVPGPRPLPLRVLNAYVDAVQAAAERDPAVVTSFLRVTTLLDPPSRLLAPALVARVARARVLRARRVRPRVRAWSGAHADRPLSRPASATHPRARRGRARPSAAGRRRR